MSRLPLLILAALATGSVASARIDPEPAEIAALRVKAEHGNTIAQYNLGLAYAKGEAVPVDLAEAYAWLTLASDTGGASRALDAIAQSMTSEQLADARRRVDSVRSSFGLAAPRPTAPGSIVVPESPPAPDKAVAIGNASIAPAPPVPAVDALQTQLRDAQAALTAQSADLAAARASAEQNRQLAVNAQQQANATVAQATADAQAARRELESARNRLVELQAAALAANAAVADLTTKLQQAEHEVAAAKEARGTAEAQIADLQRELTTVRERASAVATNAHAAAEAQNTAAQRTIAALTQERDSAKAQIATAEATAKSAQDRFASAKRGAEDSASVRQELTAIGQKLAASEAAEKTTQAQLDQEKSARLDLEKKLAAVQTDAASLAAEKQKLSAQVAAAGATSDAAAAVAVQLKSTQAELMQSQATVASLTKERDEARQRLVETAGTSQQQLAASSGQLKSAQGDLEQAKAAVATLTTERDDLRQQLAAANRTTAENASTAGGEKTKLAADLASSQRELTAANDKIGQLTRDLDAAKTELAQTTAAGTKNAPAVAVTSLAPAAAAVPPPVDAHPAVHDRTIVAVPTVLHPVEAAPAPMMNPSTVSTTNSSTRATPLRPGAVVATAAAPSTPPVRTHVIVPGDTLSKIALQYYGDARRWPEILAANRQVVRNERSLIVGRTLQIP